MSSKVYDIITNQIIEMLEAGTVPWHKPWSAVGGPANLVSKKAYRGINVFMLEFTALKKDYSSNYWLSYKQAQKMKGQVRKGEKSTMVIFWRWLEREDKETGEITHFPMLRYYRVFNAEQVDWPEGFEIPTPELPDNYSPIEQADTIIANMPNAPSIEHNGSCASYNPRIDRVRLPPQASFDNTEAYYSTVYHELVHSTGHAKRLCRFTLDELANATEGGEFHCNEELIAEMGAAMLCGITGIEMAIIDNSAAYIASWLRRLRNDKRLVVQAAGQAQKAADCIQGITW